MYACIVCVCVCVCATNLFHSLTPDTRVVAGKTGKEKAYGFACFPSKTIIASRLMLVKFLHHNPWDH